MIFFVLKLKRLKKVLPELPEVETVVKVLSGSIKSKKIKSLEIKKWFLIKNTNISQESFVKFVENQIINSLERKGKYIFLILEEFVLIFHLRMTGKFLFESSFNENIHGHSLGIIFHFQDNSKVFFCDSRNFATVHLQDVYSYKNKYPYNSIGLDLLNEEINHEDLCKNFRSRKIFIKSALLEQKFLSGIGNIYASEILFLSKINPLKITSDISCDAYKKILFFSKTIIKRSVDLSGCSIVDFINPLGEKGSYQNELNVYGKEGLNCKFCNSKIEKIYIENRSSFFCPSCQVL